jgi:putative Holliday junction resolvase
MRILALDIGTLRIGVAISDPDGRIATPVETVAGQPPAKACARIAELARTLEATRIVVGLPVELSGREGQAVRRTRRFTTQLATVCALPVDEWDERLSSAQAERSLIASDVSRAGRKQVIDQVAAVLILQSWLDRQRSASSGVRR